MNKNFDLDFHFSPPFCNTRSANTIPSVRHEPRSTVVGPKGSKAKAWYGKGMVCMVDVCDGNTTLGFRRSAPSRYVSWSFSFSTATNTGFFRAAPQGNQSPGMAWYGMVDVCGPVHVACFLGGGAAPGGR